MSGAISSILKSYQDVLTSYQTMLTGDPDAIAAAGTKLTDHASSLGSVSSDVTQRANTLASSWEGTAATAFHTAAGQLTTQVDGVGNTLRQEAQRLSAAASLLRAGKAQADSVVAQFQQQAQTLINESRTAAVGAVGAFVQAAQQLGNSAVNAAKTLADQVDQALASLFGLGGTPSNPADKHLGAVTISQKSALMKSLANQPWFRSWYRQTYGTDPDPKHVRLGTLSWFDGNGVLDGRRRPRSSPSVFGNTGWYSLTGDGLQPAGAPLKANTPFGSQASPPDDASTAGKLMNKTTIGLGTTGTQTLFDGSLVDDKATGNADLGAFGSAHGTAEFDAGLRATDNGTLSFQNGQLQAGGDVKATLVDATASGSYTAGPAAAQATGDAMVGADASGHLNTGLHGIAAHANVFAGAQVTGTASADVAGVGVGASGSLQAGIGAQFDGQATWNNGHIVVNAKAGAALGVGASVGANIDIDVPKLVNTAQQYGSAAITSVEHAANEAAGAIGNAAMQGAYMGPW
jgi:WXG100 family type VII secretion target